MRVYIEQALHVTAVLTRGRARPRTAWGLRRLCQRRITLRPFAMLGAAFLTLMVSVLPTIAPAQSTAATSSSAIMVIGNDQGGLVSRRAEEISRILAQGTHVEIRGQVCYSACTMYLGMPDTCVLPQTSFGFHGPSHYGRRLSARDFEYWSQVIASHYPDPLRNWYLTEGRTRISDYFRISGSELIRLGVRQCSARAGT